MSRLFETIKVSDKKPFNLTFHNERMNGSRRELFGCSDQIDLEKILHVPDQIGSGVYKCRVIYEKEIEKIEWVEYSPKKIERLKIIEADEIDYSYKFLDREVFNRLLKQAGAGANEDILIIKNGKITDTSYSNIVLFDGKEWHTPAEPLLKGTQRAKLVSEKRIIEKEIALNDLKSYKEIKLINAMLGFEDAPTLPLKLIVESST
ncbi:MAG: aminotransferase class IV [Ignavibacteriales bacterium]|nr:aminotransferase class IV [Ignavibacteriales bacterium]